MTGRRFSVMLILVASLGSCGKDGPAGPGQQTIPTGVTWKLECIGSPSGDTCYDPDGNEPYTIRFEENGTVSGTNACNTCTGTYSHVSTTQLQVHWSCTESTCGQPPPWLGYGDAVASTMSFAVTSGRMVLTCVSRGGERLQLVHRRAN